jgi:hypothetical protein
MSKETPFKGATTPLLDEGLKVNDQPLQIASQDQILRRYELGGPDSLRDTRLYLDRADLEELLKIAKASPTGRVVLPCAGLRWELRRSRDGHQYEIFKITSRPPQPERLPSGLVTETGQLPAHLGRPITENQWARRFAPWERNWLK